MIVGKEGVHTWDGGALVLNRRDLDPHYRVDEIPGLRSLAELEAVIDPALGRTGEVPRESTRAGKSIEYRGIVVARSLASLRTAQGALPAAFATTAEREMIAAPHPAYVGAALPTRRFHARAIAVEADEQSVAHPNTTRSGGYEMPWSAVLRLSDPRYYHAGVGAQIDVEDLVAAAIGGAGVPFTPGTAVAGPSNQGFEVVTANPGNADVDGQFFMHGPLKNPVLSNETLGVFLRFRGLLIPAGEHVMVDFRRRRAVRGGGENVRSTLDPASTWWDRGVHCLDPGANTIRLRGYLVGAGSKLRVLYTPADYA